MCLNQKFVEEVVAVSLTSGVTRITGVWGQIYVKYPFVILFEIINKCFKYFNCVQGVILPSDIFWLRFYELNFREIILNI